jgi:hypothetical protein
MSHDAAPWASAAPAPPPRLLTVIVLAMVGAIPFFGLVDTIEAFRAGFDYLDQTRVGGGRAAAGLLYVRELLLFVLVGVWGAWLCATGRPVPRMRGGSVFLLCLGLAAVVSGGIYPPVVLIAGLRQLTYLAVPYVVYLLCRESPRAEVLFVRAAVFSAAIEFAVALLQAIVFGAMAGVSVLAMRAYGTFNNPNTLGLFFATVLFLALFLSRDRRVVRKAVVATCLGGLLLSGSRASLAAGLFLVLSYVWQRRKVLEARWLVLALAALVLVPAYYAVGALAGREDVPTPLDDPRVRIFFAQLEDRSVEELLFGRGLGVGTNTLFSLGRGQPELQPLISILDSTYTALVVQVGFVGLAGFLLALCVLAARCGGEGWTLLGLTLVTGLNVNWLEFYPMNLLFTAAYGMLWARREGRRAAAGWIAAARTPA